MVRVRLECTCMVCAGGAIGDNGRRTRRIDLRRDNATLPGDRGHAGRVVRGRVFWDSPMARIEVAESYRCWTPRFHQVGLVSACSVSQVKWWFADCRMSGRAANPASAHHRSRGVMSRTIETVDAAGPDVENGVVEPQFGWPGVVSAPDWMATRVVGDLRELVVEAGVECCVLRSGEGSSSVDVRTGRASRVLKFGR